MDSCRRSFRRFKDGSSCSSTDFSRLESSISLLPGMHARVIDYLGAIWWVKSWTLFLGLISHLLEALYGVSGGFTLTDEFALAGSGLVNLTNNALGPICF